MDVEIGTRGLLLLGRARIPPRLSAPTASAPRSIETTTAVVVARWAPA